MTLGGLLLPFARWRPTCARGLGLLDTVEEQIAGRAPLDGLILNYLWGADYVAESNVVDRHVRNLRVKLQNQRPPGF